MIFDDLKIPIRDKQNNVYTPNRFSLELYRYLKSLNLDVSRNVKGSTIFITIN